MLLNNSLSDFINQVKYLEDINQGINISLKKLESYKDDLNLYKKELNQKNNQLLAQKKQLEEDSGRKHTHKEWKDGDII